MIKSSIQSIMLFDRISVILQNYDSIRLFGNMYIFLGDLDPSYSYYVLFLYLIYFHLQHWIFDLPNCPIWLLYIDLEYYWSCWISQCWISDPWYYRQELFIMDPRYWNSFRCVESKMQSNKNVKNQCKTMPRKWFSFISIYTRN